MCRCALHFERVETAVACAGILEWAETGGMPHTGGGGGVHWECTQCAPSAHPVHTQCPQCPSEGEHGGGAGWRGVCDLSRMNRVSLSHRA